MFMNIPHIPTQKVKVEIIISEYDDNDGRPLRKHFGALWTLYESFVDTRDDL